MPQTKNAETIRLTRCVAQYRSQNPQAEQWAKSYGVIAHGVETQARVFAMPPQLAADSPSLFELLHALDRLTSAAMWLVVHETYASNVYLDGRELAPEDFKRSPEGHTGGALNMVPAYAGYMAINAITGMTRSWIKGQGYTVAAIDSTNLLRDNMTSAHAVPHRLREEIYPAPVATRIFVVHTRPEPMLYSSDSTPATARHKRWALSARAVP